MIAYKKMFFQIVYALLMGLVVGLLTVVGQKYLPGSLNSLANSGAIWLVPAFFMALYAETKFSAIFLCMETLLVCVISYYWIESLVNTHPFIWGGYYFYLWMICAVVAGIIFGLAAFYRNQKSKWYYWGTSILPAAFFAEGLVELIHLSGYMHMIPAVIGRIIIGVALYFIIYKKDYLNRKPLISFWVLSALGVIGYEIIFMMTI